LAVFAGLSIVPGLTTSAVGAQGRQRLRPAGPAAITVVRVQNPHFRVRVTIRPAHPTPGQTVVASFRITNTTERTLRGEWQFTWSTPESGIGAAVVGTFPPGRVAGETLPQKVRATTPDGRYVIYAEASDRHGSSHARAHVALRSG
jgi:hypothetical protein